MGDNRKNIKKGFVRLLWTAVVVIVFAKIVLNDSLTVREYSVESEYVEGTHRYVVLTDLHSTLYGDGQEKLLREIDRYSPEAVFLVGDIGDNRREFDGTASLLEGLTEYDMYYVTGNHERWVDYADDIKRLFEKYGVIVLDGGKSVYLGDGIYLFGIDDPLFYENSEEYLADIRAACTSDESFDILLSHRPEFAREYSDSGFDLILSGHTHGGQVRIPFLLNGLYAPNQGWFPEYAGGIYDVEDNKIIVSRGLMINEYPRIFNRPEIVIVDIVGKK